VPGRNLIRAEAGAGDQGHPREILRYQGTIAPSAPHHNKQGVPFFGLRKNLVRGGKGFGV